MTDNKPHTATELIDKLFDVISDNLGEYLLRDILTWMQSECELRGIEWRE